MGRILLSSPRASFLTGKERNTEFGGADVVLTTYGLVRRDIKRLKEIPFNVIIFDEAQAVKNIIADTTGTVRQLNGYFKLTMTGTPVENHQQASLLLRIIWVSISPYWIYHFRDC